MQTLVARGVIIEGGERGAAPAAAAGGVSAHGERSSYCSLEKALWALPERVTCREFVGAVMGEFRFAAGEDMDRMLKRLYR